MKVLTLAFYQVPLPMHVHSTLGEKESDAKLSTQPALPKAGLQAASAAGLQVLPSDCGVNSP